MRIYFDNVMLAGSLTGPNMFGQKLAKALSFKGNIIVGHHENPDVQLSFIQADKHKAPIVLRLDGVWFNSEQDWMMMNKPIKNTFDIAKSIIAQSFFDKKLIHNFFGRHNDVHVINNGADVEFIQSIEPLSAPSLFDVERVWTCASSWRPHKRLSENIRYFREHAGKNDCLIIAGENPDVIVNDKRIFYAGHLNQQMLLSLYRATDVFIHLAYLDHCPNVVVDARASGAQIICSSSGGTEEIAGPDAIVINENEWDFKPCMLYKPPSLDFSCVRQGRYDISININDVASKYESVLISAMSV